MERQLPQRIRPEPPSTDPATRAFNRLEGEMALMRRAVEHVVTEKAEIDVPDYSSTLAEIAERLLAIEDAPALQMTPEDMAARINVAAARARHDDWNALNKAKRQHDEAAYDLRGLVGTATTVREQKRRLQYAVGGGLLAGMLLWSFLPGVILRALPQSWHMPENMARHIIGETTLWDAGGRLMQAGNPETWQVIVDAAKMRRDNREVIAACERKAREGKHSVRCTVQVEPPGNGD